jgi:hypothetical protein
MSLCFFQMVVVSMTMTALVTEYRRSFMSPTDFHGFFRASKKNGIDVNPAPDLVSLSLDRSLLVYLGLQGPDP